MPEAAFDPYYEWLSIPPEEQPANFYRLLGVKPGEANLNVIASAADRQMSHVRSFAGGPRAGISQRVLNELSQARTMLLDPPRKAAYDAMLRAAESDAAKAKAALAQPATDGPAEKPLAKGNSLGDYQILQGISRDESGTLYKAMRKSDGQVLSLKLIPAELGKNPEYIKRLRREFELTRTLKHYNLIAGYDMGEASGRPYLTFEFVGGADLARVVAEHGPLAIPTAIEVTRRIAEGLAYLHEKGVVHRNLKPQNILVNVQGVVKIANLTMAREEDSRAFLAGRDYNITMQGAAIGTPEYLAPEQAADAREVDGRADVYSLGCTLYHLLVGRPPYGGKNAMSILLAHAKEPIPSLREARPEVPEWLDELYQRMLAKKPDERIASAAEVAKLLAAGGEKPEPTFTMPIIVAGTVTAVVVIFLLVLVVLSQR